MEDPNKLRPLHGASVRYGRTAFSPFMPRSQTANCLHQVKCNICLHPDGSSGPSDCATQHQLCRAQPLCCVCHSMSKNSAVLTTQCAVYACKPQKGCCGDLHLGCKKCHSTVGQKQFGTEHLSSLKRRSPAKQGSRCSGRDNDTGQCLPQKAWLLMEVRLWAQLRCSSLCISAALKPPFHSLCVSLLLPSQYSVKHTESHLPVGAAIDILYMQSHVCHTCQPATSDA